MTRIVSKRHIVKFYFSIIIATIFFVAMATFLLFIYSEAADKGGLKFKDKIAPIFSVGCYVFAVYSVYCYIKNAPKITLDNNFISFNSETFTITEIKKVELTGKRPFRYAIDFPMEAATLTFSNGEVRYIFDDMYSNAWEIKSYLKQVVIDKKSFIQNADVFVDRDAVAGDSYENI
jgi:hypothetical protein